MKSIKDYIGQEIQWVHTHLLRFRYELRAGNEVLARLSSKGAHSLRVRAETADGRWTFEHEKTLMFRGYQRLFVEWD